MPPVDIDDELHKMSKKGDVTEVERLIAAGADVNNRDYYGKTPLHHACSRGRVKIVEILIASGANVNITNIYGNTPLNDACIDWDQKNVSTNDLYKIIDILIAAGADVNKVDDDGQTLIMRMSKYGGKKNIVEKLIAVGADVNKTNNTGGTALLYALGYKNPEIAEMLIAAGADVNKSTNNTGDTPIYSASIGGYLNIVEQLIAAGADVNKRRIYNGETPLFGASLYGHLNIVKRLLAAGADKTIGTQASGQLPIDVAATEEIRKLLKDVPKNAIKWLGWSRGDASMLDGVFGDDETARNFALCPVCMKYVIRKDACMYMSHNCSEQRGYHHDELYKKYKNSEGIINWCTVCGRICKGHSHFILSPSQGPVPSIIIGEDPFAPSCEGEGGGGVTEKLLRFRRLREHAKELQDEVGKKDWWEAMDELCEEMWNAPMVRAMTLNTMLETKKFNIPNTNFPLSVPEITNAPNIPYNGQLPFIHPEKTAMVENAYGMDDFNIIQFRHRKADGTMNNHAGPGQQISREAFVGWLKDVMADPIAFRFGRCWQFKTAAQLTALTITEKALMCDAILHPAEVKAALDMEDEEQRKLAEGYHKAFNLAMDTRRTIRP